jgi:hypothetical protein
MYLDFCLLKKEYKQKKNWDGTHNSTTFTHIPLYGVA